MRTALVLLCALAVPAFAQTAPSRTLERAIKLYDTQDFYAASIELQEVTSGQTGDTQANLQRAEFFQAKTLYQLGFYAASWSKLTQIIQAGDAHPYQMAVPKWIVAILRIAPNESVRGSLFSFHKTSAIDDPSLVDVRDEFAYQLGRELVGHDLPKSEVFEMFAKIPTRSPFAARAQLELARMRLRAKDIPGGLEAAVIAGRMPALTSEAAHVIATWTHIHGGSEQARAPLGELAKTSAYARYQLSRAMLDGKAELPGLDRITAETFDAVMLPSACRGRWPDDLKALARTVLAEARPALDKLLGFEDNAELFEWVRRFQAQPPAPGTDVVIAVLSDARMRERIAWVEELNKELGNLQRADRAWQTTPVAAELLQDLTVIQAVEMADAGANARQRLKLLAADLDKLDKVLADASPGFALAAGPDVPLGSGLVVTSELCRAGGGTAPTLASTKPTGGCAGCQTRESSWSFLVLVAVVLAKMRRRERDHQPRRRPPRTRASRARRG